MPYYSCVLEHVSPHLLQLRASVALRTLAARFHAVRSMMGGVISLQFKENIIACKKNKKKRARERRKEKVSAWGCELHSSLLIHPV